MNTKDRSHSLDMDSGGVHQMPDLFRKINLFENLTNGREKEELFTIFAIYSPVTNFFHIKAQTIVSAGELSSGTFGIDFNLENKLN